MELAEWVMLPPDATVTEARDNCEVVFWVKVPFTVNAVDDDVQVAVV